MSSEKPFWEGKTLMEIQNLDQRVKVTMENGDVFIGKLIRRSRDTDGICHLSMQLDAHRTYLHVFSAESSDTPPVIPSYVDTIELVDDPEYERIDNIENVQVGDIACTTEGNHFRVIDLKPDPLGDMLLRIRISEIDGEYCIDSDDFAYALRRKPKLPDHDGLWWDKDNALWSVAISGLDNSKLVALLIGDPESPVTGSVWSGLNSKHVTSQAPFRPAKVVEAYMDGAERQPTNEEIEAGAKAFYEALKPDSYPQWDSDCALRAEYYDAMRLAVKAMQGKAAEE
ncbi:hypothetical protein [Bifidobacterium longum]|uniref:hypothetical protein n=1 Tax=Bifidobacterium longum TaxID=216816 RepID=UPI001F58C00B|nr:hypothetical protein [Bifidobacterium longum]